LIPRLAQLDSKKKEEIEEAMVKIQARPNLKKRIRKKKGRGLGLTEP
jgi:hypothetical protein